MPMGTRERRDPGYRFALDVTLSRVGAVESQTHGIEVSKDSERVRIRLKDGAIVSDRNFMLSWCHPSVEDLTSQPCMSAKTIA
jgi:hypothetical protein